MLSSLDLHFLVRGWQALVGARLDKAYGIRSKDRNELLLQLHKSGEGKRLIRFILPGTAFLATAKPAYGRLPGFCTFLRKHVGNARLESIEQLGFDRIVILTFVKLGAPDGEHRVEVRFKLIIELLAPGNALLVGEKTKKTRKGDPPEIIEDAILHLFQPQQFKDRTLRGGVPYQPPPPPPDLHQPERLVTLATESGKEILVKALAMSWGLGGHYAELVCERAGIDKSKERYTKADLQQAAKALQEILAGEPPFDSAKDTALDAEYLQEMEAGTASATDDGQAKKPKWQGVLEQQQIQMAGFEKAAVQNQRQGELIYEHYQELQQLFTAMKECDKNERAAVAKGFAFVKKYDPATGTVTVDFG